MILHKRILYNNKNQLQWFFIYLANISKSFWNNRIIEILERQNYNIIEYFMYNISYIFNTQSIIQI